jgi:hypothetical protein
MQEFAAIRHHGGQVLGPAALRERLVQFRQQLAVATDPQDRQVLEGIIARLSQRLGEDCHD